MPTSVTLRTNDPEETQALGARLGAALRGGEVIALIGDLGAGKTTFTQGVLQGMGSRDRVTSPTFTLVNLYHAGALTVYHVDAYRLASGKGATVSRDELASLALDEILDAPDVVLLVEWADVAPSLFEAAALIVRFAGEDDQRAITLTAATPRLEYLLHSALSPA